MMREALENLLKLYVELVDSGDAGFWDPEKVPEVIAARAALAAPDTTLDTAARALQAALAELPVVWNFSDATARTLAQAVITALQPQG